MLVLEIKTKKYFYIFEGAPKLWWPNFVGVFLLIKVRALIKPENIESTEIHWKPVRIVRLSISLYVSPIFPNFIKALPAQTCF